MAARGNLITWLALTLLGGLLLAWPTSAQQDAVPDRILFVGNFEGDDYEVYIGDIANLRMRAITDDATDQTAARWSPDGTKILYRSSASAGGNDFAAAFGSSSDSQSQLVLVDADGSNPRVLAEGVAAAPLFSFSPDGQRIAYVTETGGAMRSAGQLTIIDLDGNLQLQAAAPAGAPALLWSSDGARLLYSSFALENTSGMAMMTSNSSTRPTLAALDIATGEETELTRLPEQSTVRGMTISPDGETLYFIQRTPLEDAAIPRLTLRSYDLNSADADAVVDLYEFAQGDTEPMVWQDVVGMSAAPDGDRLALQLETRVPVDTDVFIYSLSAGTLSEVPIYDPLLRYAINPGDLSEINLGVLSRDRLLELLVEAADNPLALASAVRDLFQTETNAVITGQTLVSAFVPADQLASLPPELTAVALRDLTAEQSIAILRSSATQGFMVEQVMRVLKPEYASAQMPHFFPLPLSDIEAAYRNTADTGNTEDYPLSMLYGQVR